MPLGYLPAPYRLSRCSRLRYFLNFTAVRTSDGPDSVQYSSFKSSRSRRRTWLLSYTYFPLFHDFSSPRPINFICNESVTSNIQCPIYIFIRNHDPPYSCNLQI